MITTNEVLFTFCLYFTESLYYSFLSICSGSTWGLREQSIDEDIAVTEVLSEGYGEEEAYSSDASRDQEFPLALMKMKTSDSSALLMIPYSHEDVIGTVFSIISRGHVNTVFIITVKLEILTTSTCLASHRAMMNILTLSLNRGCAGHVCGSSSFSCDRLDATGTLSTLKVHLQVTTQEEKDCGKNGSGLLQRVAGSTTKRKIYVRRRM